jgi:hypothetical protein
VQTGGTAPVHKQSLKNGDYDFSRRRREWKGMEGNGREEKKKKKLH